MTTQAAPAQKDAASAAKKLPLATEEGEREGGDDRGQRHEPVQAHAILGGTLHHGAEDRAGADHAEHEPVVFGALAGAPRDERKQSPIGGGERVDGQRADERGAKQPVVRGVTNAGADGAVQPFGPETAARDPFAAGAAKGGPRSRRDCPATNAQNGVDTPKFIITNPPSAGPTVRLTL